jgi:oligopeptide/dipeptide ABC transporter ATP-binding protein
VAQEKAKHLLHDVGIPEKRINAYPHQLSGGQRQRAMLAVALSCSPAVLIGDEPTTALDVIVQAQILELLDRMRQEYGLGLILITHDLAVIADMCDRVAIMYAGRIVESGSVKEIFSAPRHPYTQALLGAAPDARAGRRTIKVLEGHPPDLSALPPGCHFAPRCPLADARCREEDPPTIEYADRVTLACHRYSLGDGKLPTPIDAPYPTLELGKR